MGLGQLPPQSAAPVVMNVAAGGGTVIAVHHNRRGESENFLHAVSRTLAVAGSVDTVITLNRKRTDSSGTVTSLGRDVDDMVYKLNSVDGQWSTDGQDLAKAAQRATMNRLGSKMQEALDPGHSGMATTIREVAEFLEVPDPTARWTCRFSSLPRSVGFVLEARLDRGRRINLSAVELRLQGRRRIVEL